MPYYTLECKYGLLNDKSACILENKTLDDPYQQIRILSEGYDLREENIHAVDIRDSIITFIPNEIFSHFRYLYEISIVHQNKGLTELKQNFLQGSDNLFTIVICYTGITTLTDKTFAHSPLLRTLSLNDNQISMIEDDAFYGLPNLRSLWLVNNKLESVNKKMFQHVDNLQVIYMWNNRIHKIMPGTFDSLRSLRILDLEYNRCVSKKFKRGRMDRQEVFKGIYGQCHSHEL